MFVVAPINRLLLAIFLVGTSLTLDSASVTAFSASTNPSSHKSTIDNDTAITIRTSSRRSILTKTISATAALVPFMTPQPAQATSAADTLDVNTFLRTGTDSSGNMGVSSQTGKSRPQTGVVFRDGSDVLQSGKTGTVSAEILTGTKANPKAVLVSFDTPSYKLETGPVFDIETRNVKTAENAFIAVTRSVENTKLADIPTSVFLERLFDPTGRFSFYGPPTDIKVKKSYMSEDSSSRILEVSFSTLSQSTNSEIPRKAIIKALLPTQNVVLLTVSAPTKRFKENEASIRASIDSFAAIAAPTSNLKLRVKDRSNGSAITE